MPRRLSRIVSGLGGWMVLGLLVAPGLAHTTRTAGDVAATFHLEPNHNPRAGQPARAWFALTRRGGQLIPFARCNCQLTVYARPRTSVTRALLQPGLRPISAERYRGVPGADLTFPRAGIYELEFSGTPKAGTSFRPFRLTYEVTVQPGTAASGAQPSGSHQH